MAERVRFRAAVVVFGDLGRSPRMVRHALSLAKVADVDLIGLAGSELGAEVRSHPRIRCHRFRQSRRSGLPARVAALFGFVWRTRPLLAGADLILLQTPPPVPIAIARIFSRRRSALVIDWHNFSAAMLALRSGRYGWAVRFLRFIERLHAGSADGHLCVSAAMRDELERRWGIARAVVFHDRPAGPERPLEPAKRDRARRALSGADTGVEFSDGLLVVSPTSWGPDEDFRLLLDAAVLLDRRLSPRDSEVIFALTGDGPGRLDFEVAAARLRLSRVRLATCWIPADDYPAYLSAADVGLCLHRSASGLDLPMKLADLLGAGLPVFALRYSECLGERFVSGEDGWTFDSAEDLAGRLGEAARPAGKETLARAAAAIRLRAIEVWDDAWNRDVLPILESLVDRRMAARS